MVSTRRFEGKTALITGGGSGIGRAIASRLAAEGAHTFISDVDEVAGAAAAHELSGTFLRHDVAVELDWKTALQHLTDNDGGLHILVNNAGVEGSFEDANIEKASLEEWILIERVNVRSVFMGCQTMIPLLRDSGGGAIINISSTSALTATPAFVAYGASKAAVRHLTQSIALHCARSGSKIRCNSVHPGIVLTPMMERIAGALARKNGSSAETELENFRRRLPQGEFQTPDDVAAATAFLASDEARHITGLALVVDGGATLAA